MPRTAKRIEMTPEQVDARNAMVVANLGLAYSCAWRFWKCKGRYYDYADVEEIKSESLYALILACTKYDPVRVSLKTRQPCKLSTFATVMIWRRLDDYVMQGSVIRIPPPRMLGDVRWRQAFHVLAAYEQYNGQETDCSSRPDPDVGIDMPQATAWLTTEERDVLEMRHVLDAKYAEIARARGYTKQRAQQVVAQAHSVLAQHLEGYSNGQ